jgi:molybdopterin-guanine dinucleotide biosynthesis protein A
MSRKQPAVQPSHSRRGDSQRAPGHIAGLILAGGQSRRMGRDKASLRFGGSTLLALAVGRMRRVARPIVVSLAPAQVLDAAGAAPDLHVVRDEQAFGGPLPGLLHGFRALAGLTPAPEAVLVMPVDLPFYDEAWMRRAVEGLRGHRVCLYRFEGFVNALIGAYDLGLLPKLERLAMQERVRPLDLSAGEPTRVLDADAGSPSGALPPPLWDTDTPEDYARALAWAGIGHPQGTFVTVSVPSLSRGREPLSQPLLLRSGEEALAALARQFPERAGRGGKLERATPAGVWRPVRAKEALVAGDRLRWQPA